jgi:hypothetical protein
MPGMSIPMDEGSWRDTPEAERGDLARRHHVPTYLDVVEHLEEDRERDHETDADPAELSDRLRPEEPLTASDRETERDERRAHDLRDRLLEAGLRDVEDLLRRRKVVHGERRTSDAERIPPGPRAGLHTRCCVEIAAHAASVLIDMFSVWQPSETTRSRPGGV